MESKSSKKKKKSKTLGDGQTRVLQISKYQLVFTDLFDRKASGSSPFRESEVQAQMLAVCCSRQQPGCEQASLKTSTGWCVRKKMKGNWFELLMVEHVSRLSRPDPAPIASFNRCLHRRHFAFSYSVRPSGFSRSISKVHHRALTK